MLATVPDYTVVPNYIGPVWRRDDHGRPVLPERTLGWQILRWIDDYVGGGGGKPFKPTGEQARFILWWYALDERGRFIYRDGVLQRLKGWGKDPLVAVLSLVEMLGPCRFSHWAERNDPHNFTKAGEPVGMENEVGWVQVVAVSAEQTKNTMKLLPMMITPQLMRAHGMTKLDIGKTFISAYGGSRVIEAVTSSPSTLEGGRPTFTIRNETHHWTESMGGHELAEVIERNATKSAGGQARALSITNAYDPAQDSVAQRQREAWEAEQTGEVISTGMFYDSIEAPEDITMQPPEAAVAWRNPPADKAEADFRTKCIVAWLSTIVLAVRGDAHWLDVESIVMAILRQTTPPHVARRFWFNNIVSAADSWADAMAIEAGIDPLLRTARKHERDTDALRLGWIVDPGDPVVAFFDGSKSDDATGLVGCRLSDGYTFTIGVWSKPSGEQGKGWLVPRYDVDARVDEMFERFNVVAFWGDPSHTLDDDSTRYWDTFIDRWHRAYKDRLQTWAVKSGPGMSSIMWDMTSSQRTAQFTGAAEIVRSELHHKDHEGNYAPRFTHDGHPALVAHLRNARENRGPDGVSIRKNNRESAKKIDLAACLIGAHMLRRYVLNEGVEEQQSTGGWVTAI
jgi:hypothetical protein